MIHVWCIVYVQFAREKISDLGKKSEDGRESERIRNDRWVDGETRREIRSKAGAGSQGVAEERGWRAIPFWIFSRRAKRRRVPL